MELGLFLKCQPSNLLFHKCRPSDYPLPSSILLPPFSQVECLLTSGRKSAAVSCGVASAARLASLVPYLGTHFSVCFDPGLSSRRGAWGRALQGLGKQEALIGCHASWGGACRPEPRGRPRAEPARALPGPLPLEIPRSRVRETGARDGAARAAWGLIPCFLPNWTFWHAVQMLW